MLHDNAGFVLVSSMIVTKTFFLLISLSLSLLPFLPALKSTSYSSFVHFMWDITSTIGETDKDMSRSSSLCLSLVSPRWRLLRDNNAFPRFIWHRRRNNSTTNFTRREWRPRIIPWSSRAVTMYVWASSERYYRWRREDMRERGGRAKKWHEKRRKNNNP